MPPTPNYWAGTDGNWGTPGSWSLGHVPLSAEAAVFDGSTQTSVTDGLDRTGDETNGLDLAALIVNEKYIGNIGGLSNELTLCADEVQFMGTGQLHIKAGSDGLSTGIDRLIIDASSSPGVFLSDIGGDEEITRIVILSGTVDLAGAMLAIESLEIGRGGAGGQAPVVTINGASSAAIANLLMMGGQATCNRPVTKFIQSGGSFVQMQGAGSISDTAVSGTGTLRYQASADLENRTYVAPGATLDLSGRTSLLTIDESFFMPGAIIRGRDDFVTITIENGYAQFTDFQN